MRKKERGNDKSVFGKRKKRVIKRRKRKEREKWMNVWMLERRMEKGELGEVEKG